MRNTKCKNEYSSSKNNGKTYTNENGPETTEDDWDDHDIIGVNEKRGRFLL